MNHLGYLSFFASLLAISTAASPAQVATASGTARVSDDLVDFLGVGIQAESTDPQWQLTLSELQTLGVRHVRDTADLAAPSTYFSRHAALKPLNIGSMYVLPRSISASALKSFIAQTPDAEALEAVSLRDTVGDRRWAPDLRNDMYTIRNAANALNLTAVGPTLSTTGAYTTLGAGSSLQDFSGQPSVPCLPAESATHTACTTALSTKQGATLIANPFWVTGESAPTGTQLPASVAAIYLPRLIMEEWNAGAKRSYRPDLTIGSTADYALLTSAGAETPAFRALAGLIALFADQGSTFTPAALKYTLSGVDSTVHQAVFQKRDGTFYLALWIDAKSYDPGTQQMLTVPGQVAQLSTAAPMTLTSYTFDETGKVSTASGGLVTPQTIPVTDRLLVLKLTPQTPAPATGGGAAGGSGNGGSGGDTPSGNGSGPATYYVSNSGDDNNDGLSPAQPWKTIAKLNASTSLYTPGTSILLKRGDIFRDDYIRLQNLINVTARTTLANTPLPISGTPDQPITIGAYGTGANPLIDAADPLNVTWTKIGAKTWQATVAAVPSKLYVDSTTAETTQLLPVPNSRGAWHSGTAYSFLDLVTYSGVKYVVWSVNGAIPTPSLPYGQPYQGVTNNAPNNGSQTFSATNSGLQNVETTPGSWWVSGSTLHVHLADESNPNNHTIEGSYRPYGVLLNSVSYVTVENLSVERTQMDGIALATYSDNSQAGHYMTNQHNSVINNSVWNWGNLASGCLPSRNGCLWSGMAGILAESYGNGATGGIAIPGTVITGNYVGRSDQYFALRSMTTVAGIEALGQNQPVISNNTIATVNNECLNYATNMYNPHNVGGEVSYNYCSNNQGNFFVSDTSGGRVHHNVVANSFGEGIQIGGADSGGMLDHNLIYNVGMAAAGNLYNGIDCNGGGSYMTLANNTIINVYAASITLESGCDHAYVVNNILDQPKGNTGLFYDWIYALSPGATFRNNLYNNTTNVHPWQQGFRLLAWKLFSGEWDATQADPAYVNAAAGDFRLSSSSAGVGASIAVTGIEGGDLGAGLAIP